MPLTCDESFKHEQGFHLLINNPIPGDALGPVRVYVFRL